MKAVIDKSSKRIEWIDGLRGIACILIFTHHFLCAFFPSTHYGTGAMSHGSNGWDVRLTQSPLSAVVNGNFWVCVFCLLSGLVLSYQIFCADDFSKVPNTMVKRYFRLAFPVFVTSFIVFIMMKLSLFTNGQANEIMQSPWMGDFYQGDYGLKEVFLTSFVTVWFQGDNTFSTAFWVLKYIFIGSFLSYILSMISRNRKRTVLVIHLFLMYVFFTMGNYFYMLSVFGTFLAYIMVYEKKPKYCGIIGFLCILLGLFLGGFPTEIAPTNIYRLISKQEYWVHHSVGAILFVFGIYYLGIAGKALSGKIFRELGKISFAVYLLHIPILLSFSTTLFCKVYALNCGYEMAALISYAASFLLLIICAWIFFHTVERGCGRLTNRIVDWIMKTKEN